MEEVFKVILMQAFSYLISFFFGIVLIGFLLRGFLITYLRVRFSNGKFIMVKVRDLIKPYYVVGKIDEAFLVYKDKNKNKKRIKIIREQIYNDMKINIIEVDPVSNSAIDFSTVFKAVSGYDADKLNSLYLRALYRPTILDQKTQIIMVLCGVAAILSLISIIIGYMVLDNVDNILLSISVLQETLSGLSGVVQ